MNPLILVGLVLLVIVNGLKFVYSLRRSGSRYAGFPDPLATLNLIIAALLGYAALRP